ncbi:MAG: hypothetical protein ACI8RZ_006025 [Myxococcota bacterium]|jgi:uncharacterized protein YjbI with pentapeptide repeats
MSWLERRKRRGKQGEDVASLYRSLLLPPISMPDSDLRYAWIDGAMLEGAFFARADLQHASLRGAHCKGTNFREAVLSGADLSGTRLDDATRWPSGFRPPQ